MTVAMFHGLTPEEAGALRHHAGLDPFAGRVRHGLRIWGPVELVPASGRAHCRLCRELVPQGETVIRFEFDFTVKQRGERLVTAYLHANACGEEDA